jgi:hypothetical protein
MLVAYHRALSSVIAAQIEDGPRRRAGSFRSLQNLLQDAPIVRLTLLVHARVAGVPLDEALIELAGVASPQRVADAVASLPREAYWEEAPASAGEVEELSVVEVWVTDTEDGPVTDVPIGQPHDASATEYAAVT